MCDGASKFYDNIIASEGGNVLNQSGLQELLTELKKQLTEVYSARLRGVFLFGSYVRGEQDSASDIDVLVVLDNFSPTYCSEIEKTGEMTSQLSLKYGVSISKVFVREADWASKQTPFLDNVREEAKAA
jgi:uncharacterized protein